MPKTVTIDDFDRKLLALVQRNNLAPARSLGDAVGLSESAALRRLKRLRADGVIAADVSIVAPEALGLGLTMHVLVTMEREASAVLDAFAKTIAARAEVVDAWYVTGASDFVLLVRVGSMADYERFTRETLNDDPNVRSFKTLIAIRQVVAARR